MKVIIVLLAVFLIGCSSDNSDNKPLHYKLKVERIKGNDYWQYAVFKGENRVIEQAFVPAFPGKQPFYDSATATAVGLIVVKKLDSGIFPPSVSKSEVIDAWPMNALLPED